MLNLYKNIYNLIKAINYDYNYNLIYFCYNLDMNLSTNIKSIYK